MLSIAPSQGYFLETACPNWFAPVPEKNTKAHASDWIHAKMVKRNKRGNVKRTVFHYHLENSTGDLYGVQGKKGIDKPYVIALKATGMFFYTPFYALGMIVGRIIHIAIEISAIFWRIIPKLIQNIYTKGIFSALGNAIMEIGWEIPSEIIKDIWRIVRCPFYAIGMMAASLFAIAYPLEGRKWLGKIEYEWHEKTPYHMDIRYRKSEEQCKDMPFSEFLSEIKAGKICTLGYCMYKRGNIHEKIAGKPRFEMLEQYEKKYTHSSSRTGIFARKLSSFLRRAAVFIETERGTDGKLEK